MYMYNHVDGPSSVQRDYRLVRGMWVLDVGSGTF
jgi:hypothetical protein